MLWIDNAGIKDTADDHCEGQRNRIIAVITLQNTPEKEQMFAAQMGQGCFVSINNNKMFTTFKMNNGGVMSNI